jgi:hypothetical protein
MHVQVSASAGDVGGRHLDERHDCEQHGDDGSCDERAGKPGDGSGRAGKTAGSLSTVPGVVDGFPRGFAAAGIDASLAVFAYLRMPAVRAEGAAMHMHH